MRELRILFTGTGRRVELMQAFYQAAFRLGVLLKLYGADMAGTAPALAFCDYSRKICAMKDKDYIPQLLEICKRDRIDLVIPTIDTDLLALSENREAFREAGVRVMISSPDMIGLCRDKNKTTAFFHACGLKAPETVNDYRLYAGSYPCFIKPKDGSSSIDAYKVEDAGQLAAYAAKVGDPVIQPYIDGKEYTVDIFCDMEGEPIYITPRERLAVRSGEVLKTRIALDERIIAECRELVRQFQPCGPITVQLIRQKETGDDYYIEINPRYGGGAPLSMKAGADSAEMTLRLLLGEKPGFQSGGVQDGAVYSRFDQSIRIACESRPVEGKTRKISGVIFDLDDTLYEEKEYVRSGFCAVAAFLGEEKAADRLWQYFTEGKNAIDELLRKLGRETEKEACLHTYRFHEPEISLYEGAADLLARLRGDGIRVGIITDGRPEGQRGKLKALGIDLPAEDIIVTDELGGAQFRKPCDIAFRILQRRWGLPFEELVYIGDNPDKDFRAPMQLGMESVYFENRDGLYYREDAPENAYGIKICDIVDAYRVVRWYNERTGKR
ncbi:MAG: ATP-grasp domain-containing protein [Bacteroidales bacterium]|nr:ATP-grasp domain-containing protein [Bacteroidales bacterium]MCM1414589.1 ATP-grasp domain-containing protein [bacterium]MCM1423862.1 ATP-grasp domain-containing protein [bacterium]